MKVCACFLLFTIFALAYCAERLSEEKKKGMKLSLHTVLELDDDKKKDAGLMDVIYNFVKKLSSVLSKTKDYKEQGGMRKFREAKDMLFTDFLQEGIEKLNSYKDEDFNEFFAVLNDEIKKYHYRGCKFYELTDNLDTRRLLDAELSFIKGKPMPMTKVNLNALSYILKEEMYDDNVKEFIDHVNSLYKDDSKEKFQKVLNELEQYGVKSKRTDDKLEKIIRDGLRSVIFDHYTNLNVNIRRKLKTKIDKFWSKFRNIKSDKNSEESKDDSDATEFKNKPKTLKNNAKVGVGKGKPSKRDRKIRDILSSDESLSANKDSTSKPAKKKKIISKNLKDESSSLNSEKLSSAETFDSNSIEFSLERQQQYNTQRYATLYTESITRSPEKIAKKAKKMKSRSKPQKKNYRAESKETSHTDTLFGARQKTTPSALRTKKVDIELKQKKNDTVNNATSSNNTQVIKADDKKLKSVMKETKRQFRDPMEDTDAGSDIAPDSTELTNARKQINSKSKNPDHRRTIQVEAAFGETSKKRKSTNNTRSFRNKKDLRRDNSFPLSSIEGLSIEMFKKDRDDNLPSRRSAANNKNLNPAEVIFLKRINDLEKKINEVKHKIDVNTTRVNKGKGKDDIVKLVGGKVDEKKTKKIDKKSSSKTETEITENNQKIKSESSTKDAKEEIKDINNNKNINNDNKSTNITDTNKESTTKVRNDTKDGVASSKNEVKSGRNQRELAFSSPPFDEDFDFKKNGEDNNKKIPFINNEVGDVKYRKFYDFKGRKND